MIQLAVEVVPVDLELDRSGDTPLWQQIYRALRARILAGALPPGTRLPPDRLLATQLGVSRATVIQAYRELAAEGLVAARVGSGTRVLPLGGGLAGAGSGAHGGNAEARGGALPARGSGVPGAGGGAPGTGPVPGFAQRGTGHGTQGSAGGLPGGQTAAGTRGNGAGHGAPLTNLQNAPAPAEAPFDWTALMAAHPWPEDPPLLKEVRAARAGGEPAPTGARRRAVPGRISLAHGELAPDLVPREEMARLLQAAAAADLPWGYGPPAGYLPLREALARRLGRAGPDEVLITGGAQHGLALICRSLAGPGDAVAVETPSYFRTLTLFAGLGLRVLPVPTDGEGMRPDLLAGLLARHRPRFILISSTFQNPTGGTMGPDRRRAILALSRRMHVPVVDVEIYSELAFGAIPPSLWSLDPGAPVIQVGSCSKTLGGGLRLGWIAAPVPVIDRLVAVKAQQEMASPILQQWLLAELLARGLYDAHLARLRHALRARRDALLAALARHLPDLAVCTPDGGLHLWARVPAGVSGVAWFRAAVQAGVVIIPGEVYGAPGGVRITFSYAPPDQFDEAARRLARALARARREAPGDAGGQGALV